MDINTILKNAIEYLPKTRDLQRSWRWKFLSFANNNWIAAFVLLCVMASLGIAAMSTTSSGLAGFLVAAMMCFPPVGLCVFMCNSHKINQWLDRQYLKDISTESIFSQASATDKMIVIDGCRALNVSEDIVHRLYAVANQDDVPQGWWFWVDSRLSEYGQNLNARHNNEIAVERERAAQECLRASPHVAVEHECVSVAHIPRTLKL